MNEQPDRNNDLSYRSDDGRLDKCTALLVAQLIKTMSLERQCLSFLNGRAIQIKYENLTPIIEQFAEEGELQIKRLNKIYEALKINRPLMQQFFPTEIAAIINDALETGTQYSLDDLARQWVLILSLQQLIHYKMACYQSMADWAKYLQVYGVQELLEDSLDEFVHQDLLLSLLSGTW